MPRRNESAADFAANDVITGAGQSPPARSLDGFRQGLPRRRVLRRTRASVIGLHRRSHCGYLGACWITSRWQAAVGEARPAAARDQIRPGTFRERVDPCQHCGWRHDGRMRMASAATFPAYLALSLPPAVRFRAFYRRHAAARSKAAAAGSQGSRARCKHRLFRAQPWVLLVETTIYPWLPVPTMARAESLLTREFIDLVSQDASRSLRRRFNRGRGQNHSVTWGRPARPSRRKASSVRRFRGNVSAETPATTTRRAFDIPKRCPTGNPYVFRRAIPMA